MYLMLHPRLRDPFRRTLHRGTKKEKRLEFHAGQPVEVSAADAAQLATEIGTAVVPVRLEEYGSADERGNKPQRPKVLWDQLEEKAESGKRKAENAGGADAGKAEGPARDDLVAVLQGKSIDELRKMAAEADPPCDVVELKRKSDIIKAMVAWEQKHGQ